MICPRTEKKCRAFECLRIKGCRLSFTLAEIERSLDALGSTMYQEWCGHATEEDVAFARAAHLAIVQKYGAQNGQT